MVRLYDQYLLSSVVRQQLHDSYLWNMNLWMEEYMSVEWFLYILMFKQAFALLPYLERGALQVQHIIGYTCQPFVE